MPGREFSTEDILRALRAAYITKPHAEGITAHRDKPANEEDLFEITGLLVVGRKLGQERIKGGDVYLVVLAQKHLATGFMVAQPLDFSEELLDDLEQRGMEMEIDRILETSVEAALVEPGRDADSASCTECT